MAHLDDRSAAFIVRIWQEPGNEATADAAWRGSIEHVHSRRRAYFLDAEAIVAFVQPYIAALCADDAGPSMR